VDKKTKEEFINTLKARFEKNRHRHQTIDWQQVEPKLLASAEKLRILYEMELTDGQPDVVGIDKKTQAIIFFDCAPESPSGRRSLCYDRAALEARKNNKPNGSALELAAAMGIELLTEQEYRALQALGDFDKKTSSWVKTPDAIRALGGALFCDRRYDQVFLYHNGAESYYAARGFRACLRL